MSARRARLTKNRLTVTINQRRKLDPEKPIRVVEYSGSATFKSASCTRPCSDALTEGHEGERQVRNKGQ